MAKKQKEPDFVESLDAAVRSTDCGVLLDAGCGGETDIVQRIRSLLPKRHKYIRLDIDKRVKPDIVSDVRDMKLVKTGSVDIVVSMHVLEHLLWTDVFKATAELCRVLKPNGLAVIGAPDLLTIAEEIVKGNLEKTIYHADSGDVAAIDVIYGWRPCVCKGNQWMAHQTGFTAPTLGAKIVHGGFVRAMCWTINYNLYFLAWKQEPKK